MLMVANVLYRKNSPMEREAVEFAKRLERLRVEVKLVEADSVEGSALTELYDVPGRPSVVLTTLDGTMVERWQHQWPVPSEVSYLAHQ
jgi:hypothetical protein